MVDSGYTEAAGEVNLRSVFESCSNPVVLVVATVRRCSVVDRRSIRTRSRASIVCLRFCIGPAVDIFDQSLRSLRPATGLALSSRRTLHDPAVWDARTISPRQAPSLRWLAVCVLEHTDDDIGASALLNSHNCL